MKNGLFRYINACKKRYGRPGRCYDKGQAAGIDKVNSIFIRTRTVFGFLFLIGLIVYLNSFNVPFHYDDIYYLKENLQIKSLETLWRWFPKDYSRVFTGRPFLLFTFFLNYKLGGLDTFGYHFLNLLIHVCNAFLLYLIFFRYAETDGGKSYSPKYFLASVIFLIHPINTESVTYISSRSSVLSAFFVLASMLAFFKATSPLNHTSSKNNLPISPFSPWRIRPSAEAKAGKRGLEKGKQEGGKSRFNLFFYSLSMFFFILGLSTKEATIVLPALLILFDYSFISKNFKSLLYRFKYHLPYLIIIGSLFVLYVQYITSPTIGAQRPWLTHIFTEIKVFAEYLRLLILPVGLNIDHDIKISNSIDVNVLISFLILLSLFVAAILLRKSKKTIAFSIFWFFINLMPFLVIRLDDFMAERWVYLASIGFSLGLAGILILMLSQYKRTGVLSIGAVIVIFGILTPLRNQAYSSGVSLWEDAAKKSPDNINSYLNLSVAYREVGNPERAVEYAQKAIEKGGKRGGVPIIAYINLSAAFADMGEYEKAVEALKSIEKYSANNYKYYHNLGYIYMKMNQCGKALPLLEKAVHIMPNAPETFFAMGGCYEILSQEKKAREYYKRVTETVAQSGQDYIFQGIAFSKLGDDNKAIESFFDAVKADPLDVGARIIIGNSLLKIRHDEIAFKHFSVASEISSHYAPAYVGMGKAMLATGNLKEARKHFNKALSLLPPASPERQEILRLLDKTKG